MSAKRIANVVIAGGGTAGWITASLIAKVLGNAIHVTLIESEQIGTIGVGEATIPPILILNKALGIDEADFLRATQGTIKLGIEFHGWSQPGTAYMHAFGNIGKDFPFCSFHHFWVRARQEGSRDSLWDYSLAYQAAKQNRFDHLDRIDSGRLQGLVYAYHFDAGFYAAYLRKLAEELGVARLEGLISNVNLNAETGFIESISLQDGRTVAGDLFIDCTGFRALLIGQALGVDYEDWGHWLPCDRAVAVPSEPTRPMQPYTRSTTHEAGWQWRIPLQHRVGNGLVYCSEHLSDERASELLLSNLESRALAEPRILPFRTGRRISQWHRNCVAVGLAGGFLEPLESTSIHMIQSAVTRLIKMFPHAQIDPVEIDEYNRQSQLESAHIRDFIILHYWLNERPDDAFWETCRRMKIPDSLAYRIDLFQRTGKVFRERDELFSEIAWQQVMIGQGVVPRDYHPLVDTIGSQQLGELLGGLKTIVAKAVSTLPDHEQFLRRFTRSKEQ